MPMLHSCLLFINSTVIKGRIQLRYDTIEEFNVDSKAEYSV